MVTGDVCQPRYLRLSSVGIEVQIGRDDGDKVMQGTRVDRIRFVFAVVVSLDSGPLYGHTSARQWPDLPDKNLFLASFLPMPWPGPEVGLCAIRSIKASVYEDATCGFMWNVYSVPARSYDAAGVSTAMAATVCFIRSG